jgi:ATP-binding cassette subfamily B multidrug efflux pump
MRTIIKTAGPYLWRYRRGLTLGMGALLIKDLLAAALPLVIRSGVDSLTRGFRIELVFQFAALLVALSLIKGVFQY